MLGASIFSFATALFLLGCALTEFLNEPRDEPFGDAAYGDEPFIAADDLKLFHAETNSGGGQHDHA